MINVAFNMETADPDDVITLCFLSDYPGVNLIGVVVTPGSDDQIALVKHVLKLLNKDILIGARLPHHPKKCVSAFHYKWFGSNIEPADPYSVGGFTLATLYEQYPDMKILSGAPLGNVYRFLQQYNAEPELFIQGGFAGDNVVPKEYRLEKFVGKLTCPTFNLGGDKEAALYITSDLQLQNQKQYFVSKNVCHGVVYDKIMHEKFAKIKDNRPGLNMIYKGMSIYLKDKPNGKLFHDPLAACALIDKSVCEWAKVKLYYNKGEWGSELKENSNTHISIKVNADKFEQILLK